MLDLGAPRADLGAVGEDLGAPGVDLSALASSRDVFSFSHRFLQVFLKKPKNTMGFFRFFLKNLKKPMVFLGF